MKTDQDIEIPLSKIKLILILLGSIGFVVAGAFLITLAEEEGNFMIVIGILSILFFGVVGMSLIPKLFDKKPGLIIGKAGLLDNSSAVAPGLIKWEDIEGFSVVEVSRQKLILLYLRNPQEYIDKQTNRFRKRMMSMNHKTYNTPISISSNALKCKFDDLVKMLETALKENRS